MIVKYKNSIDDLVELNIFAGGLSFKRWVINKALPILYTIVTLGLGGWLITRYGGLVEANRILLLVLILCNIFIWVRVTLGKRKVFRKSLQKMIDKNPAHIQKKSITRDGEKFLVLNLEDKSRKVTFKLGDIFRVMTHKGFVYAFRSDYSPLFMIPEESFKNKEEIEEFFKGIEVEEY